MMQVWQNKKLELLGLKDYLKDEGLERGFFFKVCKSTVDTTRLGRRGMCVCV